MFIEEIIENNGKKKYKKIVATCDKCQNIFRREKYLMKKMRINPLYDVDYCRKCWAGVLNRRQSYRENMSAAINKMYKEHPEVLDKKSKSMIASGANVGLKNGMKSSVARLKASRTRKRMFVEDPGFRDRISIATSKAWAEGKFDNAKVGKCKWYDYLKLDGTLIKAQGTWELAFVKWADKNKLSFTSHRGRVSFIDEAGKARNYYPDFFVDDWNCYVDIKNDYHYEKQKEKFEQIMKFNPQLKLKILRKNELKELGVVLNDKSV